MATWTYTDTENVLEHITLREHYRDGVLNHRQLLAHNGYAIYNTTEELYTDLETGETYPPTYSYQVSCPLSVDYTIYRAKLIDETMDVVGGTPTPPETEVASTEPETETE